MKVRNDLRGDYILSLSKPETTTYGLNSFSYLSAKQWDALADFFRTSFFADFKTKIQDVTFMQILLPDTLKLKIVNCELQITYFFMCLLLLLPLFYNYYL